MRTRIAALTTAALFVVTTLAVGVGPGVAAVPAGDRGARAGAPVPTGAELGPGQALAPGQSLVSADGQVELDMQTDGNLVGSVTVVGERRVLWSAGTAGEPGAHAVMQTDGNLVVSSPTGAALWSSGTAGHPGAAAAVQDDGNTVVYGPGGTARWSSGTSLDFIGPDEGPTLQPGRPLGPGAFLQSPNGRYRLYETPEGAPGLYQQGADGLWWLMEGSDSLVTAPGVPTLFSCALCTETGSARPGSALTLQADGNLVLSPPGGGPAEWSAGLAGDGGASLRVQDDGNLVLYRAPGAAGAAAAVWQTGTDRFRGTVLGEGVTLGAGQFVVGPDGTFEVMMQADGNLVAYGAGRTGALWASGTRGDPGTSLTMQEDGNLVVYGGAGTGMPGSGGPVTADWSSGTAQPAADPGVAYATVAAPPARSAAGAFEAAFGSTVPPPLVAANRAALVSLVATNLLGQNTPAIATTEARYEEMWAQDAAAMSGYAASATGAPPVPVALLDHLS